MKQIEDKSFIQKKDEEEVKPKNKPISIDKVLEEKKTEYVPDLKYNNGLLRKEHPKLSELYLKLNQAIYDECVLGGRSWDLKKIKTAEVEEIRRKIRDYCKNEGITREDHQRWSND